MARGSEEQDSGLKRREAAVAAREAALAERMEAAQAILDAADARDAKADVRDAVAAVRENDLDRAQFLTAKVAEEYGGDWPERRNSSLDREQAKDDRTASHQDRVALTENEAGNGTDET